MRDAVVGGRGDWCWGSLKVPRVAPAVCAMARVTPRVAYSETTKGESLVIPPHPNPLPRGEGGEGGHGSPAPTDFPSPCPLGGQSPVPLAARGQSLNPLASPDGRGDQRSSSRQGQLLT